MKLIKSKLDKLSLGGAFTILWLACIFSFIFTLDFSNDGKTFPTFLTILFLGNILAGIIVFLLGILSIKLFKRFGKTKIIGYAPLIALIYFLFYVTTLTANGYGLIAGQISVKTNNEVVKSANIPTSSESPTLIPTYTPTQIPEAKAVYVDPDPIVNCSINSNCGGGVRQMKKSECHQSTCCQIGNIWSMYPNNTACDQAQSNYKSNKSGSNYPPCIVYYPALKTSSTYSYTSPETCRQWQDAANAGSTNTIQQATPAPTQDNSEYNALLKKHQEACAQAVAEWIVIRENWSEANKGKYSSSVEEYSALRQRMVEYQQELYSVGCTQIISL